MSRNVFLSFLGNTQYLECIYTDSQQGHNSQVVRFVQEALCAAYCKNWVETDKIFIFVTEKTDGSKEQNWFGKKYNDAQLGLKARLEALNLTVKAEAISIPEGFSEKENEAIFLKLYNCLQEGDNIYLDITNAFRSIPIFATALVDYTRFLKKDIAIQSVFYGAFEALHDEGKKLISPPQRKDYEPQNRFAPIIHLTDMLMLQNWTIAANDFINHGNTTKLAHLAKQKNLPVLATLLEEVTGVFSTVRGNEIVKAHIFTQLNQELTQLELTNASEPLKQILKKIKMEFSVFNNQDVLNGIKAVEWCIHHNLIQQGITLLQETIITFICVEIGIQTHNYKKRKYVSNAFNCMLIPETDWKGVDVNQVKRIQGNTSFQQLEPAYNRLKDFRNDINHGGYERNARPFTDFKAILTTSLNEVKCILSL